MNDQNLANWYIKQVLDAIDCEDQTNNNLSGANTCFYLCMSFDQLQTITKSVIDKYDKTIEDIIYIAKIECLYYIKIYKYIDILDYHKVHSFVSWQHQLAMSYVNTVLEDILILGDSKDYPKGLKTTSDYFEDLFEEDLEDYPGLSLEDFSNIANIVDTKLQEIRDKYTKQRILDNI